MGEEEKGRYRPPEPVAEIDPKAVEYMLKSIEALKEQKKKEAQERGLVVRYKKDLKCPKHPKTEFVRNRDPIEESYKFFTSDKDGFKFKMGYVYSCSGCLREEIDPNKITKAHGCPFCGLVIGKVEARKFFDDFTGTEGINFYCCICGTQIGKKAWRFHFDNLG